MVEAKSRKGSKHEIKQGLKNIKPSTFHLKHDTFPGCTQYRDGSHCQRGSGV